MPHPFDAATKYLVERQPADWLELLGLPRAAVRVIEGDLSTVSAAADMVLWVEEARPWLLQLELQSGYNRDLPGQTLEYSVLLWRRHRLEVRSAVVLLRPAADGPAMTGAVELHWEDGTGYLGFRYQVVRVWQQPVEGLLAAGLGTLPLAPLADVAAVPLREVIRRMEERIEQEAPPEEAGALWTATYVLMGLRYPAEVTAQLLQGVRAMKESVTYQAILAEGREEGRVEGRVEEARAILLRQGQRRFGPPSAAARAALEAITAIERLELMSERLLDAESWEELLAG